MVRSSKVQNFLKPGRNLHSVYTEAEWMPPWRVFWHSRVASGLKCWPMSQCRDKLPLSMGFKSLSTDSTVAVSTGSASIDLKTQQRHSNRLRGTREEEEEKKKKKAGCMMKILIPMRVQSPVVSFTARSFLRTLPFLNVCIDFFLHGSGSLESGAQSCTSECYHRTHNSQKSHWLL